MKTKTQEVRSARQAEIERDTKPPVDEPRFINLDEVPGGGDVRRTIGKWAKVREMIDNLEPGQAIEVPLPGGVSARKLQTRLVATLRGPKVPKINVMVREERVFIRLRDDKE
jgi:hypothetical protein